MKHYQFKPLLSTADLAPTLAQRVAQLRELRNLTRVDLAKLSRLSHERIEDIESGIETWLSAVDRQKLSRALGVEPAILQEVEARSGLLASSVSQQDTERILQAILDGERNLECPSCGGTLKCFIDEGFDLQDRPIHFARAFCLRCPYVVG